MNGHATTRLLLDHEENLGLLEEKTISDVESESGRADLENRFSMPKWVVVANACVGFVRTIPWRLALIRAAIFFLPSFLQSRFSRERTRSDRLFPTSYLDGMRGLAALFVFFCHYTYQSFIIAEGWGSTANNYHFLKLPLIRLWYQGPPMVCLFFVISGYALSMKPLKLMRNRSFDEFATTLASLTFRRGIRLYMPTAISTFMIVVMLRVGMYEWTRDFANDRTYMRNVAEIHPEPLVTTWEQLTDWVWNMYNFVHVFGWERFGGTTHYDIHLWTIPVEFRCSMYLFMTFIGMARLRTGLRFLFLTGIMAFTYRNSRWELLLFYCGMMLAELDHIRGAHNSAQPSLLPLVELRPLKRKLQSWSWNLLSIVALYLMSQPDVNYAETPGWVWLSSLIPSWWQEEGYRYWQSAGAVLFALCVGHSPIWQRFFNTAVVQYFGKISYAMYLMHGPVMHTAGYIIERWAWGITGVEGYWYNAGFVLGSLGCVPAVIWAADVFWRLFDIPTVRFAKWLEAKCINQR